MKTVPAAAIGNVAIAPSELGKMDSKLHNGDVDAEPNRQDVGTRSLWRGAARFVFAVLCLVAASVVGSASNRVSPVQIGTAQDTAPSADAQRDSNRNLLRLHAEIATPRSIHRPVDASGPQPDPHSSAILTRQSVAWLAGGAVGPAACHDRAPPWLAVRAGYPRAPPTAIG